MLRGMTRATIAVAIGLGLLLFGGSQVQRVSAQVAWPLQVQQSFVNSCAQSDTDASAVGFCSCMVVQLEGVLTVQDVASAANYPSFDAWINSLIPTQVNEINKDVNYCLSNS